MLVNVYIKNGTLMIGEEGAKVLPYQTVEMSLSDEILEDYEVTLVGDRKYIKDAIKLKEAGFTADEIIELIGKQNV